MAVGQRRLLREHLELYNVTAVAAWNRNSLVVLEELARDDGTPRWAGHVVEVPSGRWYVVLSAGNDWRLSGTWNTVERLVVPAGYAGDGA